MSNEQINENEKQMCKKITPEKFFNDTRYSFGYGYKVLYKIIQEEKRGTVVKEFWNQSRIHLKKIYAALDCSKSKDAKDNETLVIKSFDKDYDKAVWLQEANVSLTYAFKLLMAIIQGEGKSTVVKEDWIGIRDNIKLLIKSLKG